MQRFAIYTSALTTLLFLGAAEAQLADAEQPVVLAKPQQLQSAPDLRLDLQGPIRRQMDLVTERWLIPAPDANPAMLAMLAEREKAPPRNLLPWSGEFAGKYLTSGAEMLRTTGSPALKARLNCFVADLIPCQDANGYLGAFSKEYQLTGRGAGFEKGGTWDAWNHYHAMVGLLTWHEITGDGAALDAARKIGDLLCARFADPKQKIVAIGSAEMNQAVVHSLALLYRATGDKKYIQLAEKVVAEFAEPGAGDYLRTGLAGKEFFQTHKPRWESLHPIMGLAELYWITGNEDYRKAFEHHWWSIAKLDRHNNGGFSSGEQAQGNPYHGGAIETCCTVAWMAMSVDMLRMTGNPIVADELELSMLNQIVGLHGATGEWCTYNTPMDGRRIPSTEDISFQIRPGSEQLNCCSVNAARGFGMLASWAVMTESDAKHPTLVVNWYGAGSSQAKIGETAVTLRQHTDYPRDGRVMLEVEPASEIKVALKLRIPHWSAASKLSVNGRAIDVQPGAYATIERVWKRGDRVTLDLDFSPRYWVGERECAGKVCVYRGPLLLAIETPGLRPTFSKEFAGADPLHVSNLKGATVEYAFVGDRVKWNGYRYDDGGKSRVSIDGKQVAIVDQYGPGRELPFAWEKQGLGDGAHTLKIEVLGEKVAASKGVWANVGAIEPENKMPRFDPEKLTAALASRNKKTPGRYVIADDQGREQTLCEYGIVGADRGPYATWLSIAGKQAPAAAEFAPTNPSRTSRKLQPVSR